METITCNYICIITLFFITFFVILKQRQRRISRRHQPPGPPAWPVVGNLWDLGGNLNQSLYKLRLKYGDLLWLQLGWTNTLVIQTAKAAQELFKSYDTSFCDRYINESNTCHNFHEGSLALSPYGSHWRILRRLVTLGLMTSNQIQKTELLRRKCIDDMIQYIQEDSAKKGEIELGKYLFTMAFNLMGNLVLSRDLVNPQSKEGNEFYDAMEKVMVLCGKPNFADFFPFLRRFDIQRIRKNMDIYQGRTLSIVEKFVKERIEDKKVMTERDDKDLLDILLEYNESGDDGRQEHEPMSTQNMIIIIVEMFFGGTETTSGTIEWVMTELFRNPESMEKLKEELDRVVGAGRVKESDLNKLTYLHAVIKETMRLHPVIPLLIPRIASEDTKFMGYLIPKDTQVFVNAWGIGRDPEAWNDPLEFKPERFIGSNIEYRGQNFELIPFGSGRRICVGFPLAHQVLHLTVATLVHCFDWKVDGKSAMDTNERFGITVKKLIPLKAIPKMKLMT